MRPAELVERPRLLLPAAVVLQWLTTAVVALRAEGLTLGPWEAAQVVLLAPLAIVLAYAVAARIGGAALGAWTLLVWLSTPWLAHVLALASYDAAVRDLVLPLALGLEADAGFVEGVALLAALTLALWGRRETLVAAAIVLAALAVVWAMRATPFLEPSWDVLRSHSGGLREYFWSNRLLQWLPLAGAVAVARRSPPAAAALLAWFLAYVVLRAAQPGIGFEEAGIFRALLPALPAYVLLAAALPLLVPTLAARLGPLATPAARPRDEPAPRATPAVAPGSSSDPTGGR